MFIRFIIVVLFCLASFCYKAQGPVNSCTLTGALLHQQNPLAGCGNGSNYCNLAALFVPAYSPTACGTSTVGTTGTSTQTYTTKVVLPAGCTASITAEFKQRNSYGAPVNPSGTGCSNCGMDSGDNLFIQSAGGSITAQGSTMVTSNSPTCGAYPALGTYTTGSPSLLGGCSNSSGTVAMIFTGGSFTVGGTSNRSDEFVTYTINMSGTCGPSCNLVLPVELASFNAKINEQQIDVFWTVYTEKDLKRYTLEKSTDGETWQFLAEVIPTGEQYNIHHYSITDDKPAAGLNYYKLSSHDVDGTVKSHPITHVIFTDPTQLFSVTQDDAKILVQTSNAANGGRIILTDMSGRTIFTGTDSNFTFLEIEKSLIGKGTYIIYLEKRPDLGRTKLVVY